jgi:beta-ketodecanoyl-[acyl-carrier-protein] synthase
VTQIVVSGTGLYTPAESISNDELVASFNEFVRRHNERHASEIQAGTAEPLQPSSTEFIVKASGIKSRYVINKSGILDPEIMRPQIPNRGNDEPSIMCEMGVAASRQALERAGRTADDVDAVLVACSNMQRGYPAMAVELQHYLGIKGYGYDINVACASAAFGIQAAVEAIARGDARSVLVVSPEICSGHLNFRDRDSHFIFGDACTAVLVEKAEGSKSRDQYEILGTRLLTQFSNNIRNNHGFLNRAEIPPRSERDILFVQEGRKVFKEVVPAAAQLITEHLHALSIEPASVKRFWLHQANLGMNQLISKKVLGRDATEQEAPVILDEYANTSSAGSVIAFHKYHADLAPGDIGVLCAFGAGYSVGSVVMRRL